MKLLKAIAFVTGAITAIVLLVMLVQRYPAVVAVGFCVVFFAMFVAIVYSELD
jgi:hypothetical protein